MGLVVAEVLEDITKGRLLIFVRQEDVFAFITPEEITFITMGMCLGDVVEDVFGFKVRTTNWLIFKTGPLPVLSVTGPIVFSLMSADKRGPLGVVDVPPHVDCDE